MKLHFIVIGLLITQFGNAYAETITEEQIEKYKQNYSAQLIPLLKDRMGMELEIQSEEDAQEHVSTLANRMAGCQLVALEDYPQKYQDASISPVANGVDLRTANADLNIMIQEDIKNGDITDDELKTLTDAAVEKYKACLSENESDPSMPM